jgi:hypothetical protein
MDIIIIGGISLFIASSIFLEIRKGKKKRAD